MDSSFLAVFINCLYLLNARIPDQVMVFVAYLNFSK